MMIPGSAFAVGHFQLSLDFVGPMPYFRVAAEMTRLRAVLATQEAENATLRTQLLSPPRGGAGGDIGITPFNTPLRGSRGSNAYNDRVVDATRDTGPSAMHQCVPPICADVNRCEPM